MFLWVLFLHNYIIPQKSCIIAFFAMQPFLLFFYSAFFDRLPPLRYRRGGSLFQTLFCFKCDLYTGIMLHC